MQVRLRNPPPDLGGYEIRAFVDGLLGGLMIAILYAKGMEILLADEFLTRSPGHLSFRSS